MNNDLISRKALREDLRRFFTTEVLEGIEPKTLFAQIMHDIDNAPAVENTINVYPNGNVIVQERPHGKWIPVSKQLPDKYDSYLVMWRSLTEGYPDRLFYEICEYVPDEDEWERIDQAGEAGAEIIAWMPLPKPYKEGGAE